MNRPIEFRAWVDQSTEYCVTKPKMHYFNCKTPLAVLHPNTGELWWNGDDEDETRKVDGKIILMQYTGLTDKNRKKIFEGDIVNDYLSIGKVIWHKQSASFRVDYGNCIDDMFDIACVEIIGNIFENPELLEVK